MKLTILLAPLVAAALTACSGGQPAPAPAPASPADRLEAILATEITPQQGAAFDAFAAEQGERATRDLLTALAVDRDAPPLARANAVVRMGEARIYDWDVYLITIADPDPRVRGATLGAVSRAIALAPNEATPILARGLVDSEPGIQAKALQELRDRNLELLYSYLERDPPPELRDIALQIVRNSQAWGTPLEPEADGTLRRIAPAGVELTLRPVRRWPEFEMIVGTLTVGAPGGETRTIADSVEAVGGVIPAVVDANGRYVAVESSRRIDVHDLETGAVRSLGPGIAPRPLPFSNDILYWRELDRVARRAGATIRYEFVRAPFDGGPPVPFDTAEVMVEPTRRGYMSPLRWARVVDHGTAFVVHTDGMQGHPLPTPLQGMAE